MDATELTQAVLIEITLSFLQCSKYHLHGICILTSADLPQIKRVMEWNVWFFNKYFMKDDHVVMDCVEEVLVRNNKQEFTRDYPDNQPPLIVLTCNP